MFQSTTTIRHQFTLQKNFFKEKRLIFVAGLPVGPGAAATGVKGFFGNAWSKITGFGRGAKGVLTSWPVRITFFPVATALSITNKGYQWGKVKVIRGARFGKEFGLGAVDATLSPLWRLVKAPLIFLKKNIIDNTRDGISAILKTPFRVGKAAINTPGNLLRIPKNLFLGASAAITDTRKHIGETIKDAANLSPLKTINGVRKSLLSALAMPFKTIGAPLKPLAYEPTVDIAEPWVKTGGNIYDSVAAFPKSIISKEAGKDEGAVYKVINGVRRMVDAWATTAMPAAEPVPA